MSKQTWKFVTSIMLSFSILLVAIVNRSWLVSALSLVRHANHMLLVLALLIIFLSYLIVSQVLGTVLRSMGHHLSIIRLWAIVMVAIILSQSIPAGGLWSYTFLVSMFRRQQVPSGEAALAATLDVISYGCAMLITVSFSILYLATNHLGTGRAVYSASGLALLVISGLIFFSTRSKSQLTAWLFGINHVLSRVVHRSLSDERLHRLIDGLVRGRKIIASQPRIMLILVCIQFIQLCGHSLAMWVILYSLGLQTSFVVVFVAFGIALITSVFNVLPGGGGTVEAALVAVLIKLGVGQVAVPGAILFRLFNFWFMLPLAAACYHWLMHSTYPIPEPTASSDAPQETGLKGTTDRHR